MNVALPIETTETNCNFCGSHDDQLMFEGPDRLERLPGQFRLVQCRQCGLVRQNPRLTWNSLEAYYPENYISYGQSNEHAQAGRRWIADWGTRKRVNSVERHVRGGSILEVGCGTGLFIAGLLRRGHWQVTGIEPTKYACEYARTTTGATIYNNRFSEIQLPDGSFDVVAMWNVLEHVDDPSATLLQVSRLLRPQGLLVFSVPNVESLAARVFGKYWLGWDQPRHLFLFPAPMLRPMLDQAGYDLVEIRCISTSYATLGVSLDFWTQTWEDKHPRARKIVLRGYHSWLTRLLMLVPLWVLERLKQTSIITYFVRKR